MDGCYLAMLIGMMKLRIQTNGFTYRIQMQAEDGTWKPYVYIAFQTEADAREALARYTLDEERAALQWNVVE